MDLSQFCTKESSEAGSWLEVMDWDGETPIGASILVLGPDSNEAMKIADEMEKDAQKQMAEMFANKKAAAPAPSTTGQEKLTGRAVRLTKGWKNLSLGERAFDFNEPNARWLYENSPFIRDQVLSFHQKRVNFTKSGSPSLPKQSAITSGSTTPAKAGRV